MSDIVLQHNVAALGSLKSLSAAASAVAAGTGDATTTSGTTIDRFGFNGGGIAGSASLAVVWDTTLSSGKTLTLGYAVQHSTNNSDWTDYATGSSVVATGLSTGAAQSGEYEVGVDLHSCYRYVRLNTAPDLSATGTDTCVTRSVGFFAGFDKLPQ